MRLIIEPCQDQQQFLSFLVTQNSTKWMTSKIVRWNYAAKVENERLRPWKMNSSHFFEKRKKKQKKRGWKTRWVQIIRLYDLLAISFLRFHCRIRVDIVFTQSAGKSREFSIAAFGGINEACRYGDTWVWMNFFFNFGSFFGFPGLSGLRLKERN